MYDASYGAYESRLKDIRKFLENRGFEVYFRSQHKGACVSKYVVVASAGDTKLPYVSSVQNTVEIMCYVPVRVASELEEFCDQVKEAIKGMYPMIINQYNDIGDFIDDDIKAVMRTIQYKFYKKIER